MEIDKKTIKALAAERRLEILKALAERRKMQAEIAKQFNLSPSTVAEHMNTLEEAGLVKKIPTSHKWNYYELTEKGSNIIKPKFPVQFTLILSLGIIFALGGLIRCATPIYQNAKSTAIEGVGEIISSSAETTAAPKDYIGIFLILIGMLIISIALIKKRKIL